MSLAGWQTFKCDCGEDHLLQLWVMSWHEGQGTVTKPDGMICPKCNNRMDSAKMVALAKENVVKQKIKELQDQL